MPRWARWTAFWGVIALGLAFAVLVVLEQRGNAGDEQQPRPAAARSASPSSPASPPASPSASPSTSRSASAGRRRVVLFVGDAYLAYAASPARTACRNLHWRCGFDLRANSGYTAGKAYASRLAADRRYTPDLVVVTGGRSDLGRNGVRRAARSYLAAVARQFPKADLVVVEPFWNDDVTYDAVATLRRDVHLAARAGGATWVPSEGWLGRSDSFLDGGQRLSSRGQQMLAVKLIAALNQLD